MERAEQAPEVTSDQFKGLLLQEAAALAAAIRSVRIGDNQWRTLVSASQEAAVVDEVRALIEYKIGKDETEKDENKTWSRRVDGTHRAGELALAAVDRIVAEVRRQGAGEQLALRALALFFGYMAWRVVALRVAKGGQRA